jgi:hypothetical protein
MGVLVDYMHAGLYSPSCPPAVRARVDAMMAAARQQAPRWRCEAAAAGLTTGRCSLPSTSPRSSWPGQLTRGPTLR